MARKIQDKKAVRLIVIGLLIVVVLYLMYSANMFDSFLGI